MAGSRTSTLHITNAVYPDHDGVYTCVGSNSHGGVTNTDSATITVQVLVIPEVTLMASQMRVALGNSVTLTCNVTRAAPSTGYTYTWTFTGDDGMHTTIDGETTDTLEISDVMESDYGDYTCNVTNTAGTGESNTVTIVQGSFLQTTTALFQLRLHPISICGTWVGENRDQKFSDIVSEVLDVVNDVCSCTFDDSNIQNNEFSCRSVENTVVYRAEITYTALPTDIDADDFVELISDWVQSGASIVVDDARLDVDSTCPTELESFASLDCETEQQPGAGEGSDGGSTDISVAIVVGVLGGVCALMVMIVSITVVIALVRRKQKTFRPKTEEFQLQPQSLGKSISAKTNSAYGKVKVSSCASALPQEHGENIETNKNAQPSDIYKNADTEDHAYDTIPFDH